MKRLFHGDIKPDNLFVTTFDSFVTSDSGSLVPLYGTDRDTERFRVTTVTRRFCSQLHYQKWLAKERYSIKQLLDEDLYQFKTTVEFILERKPYFRDHPMVQLILDQLLVTSSIVQLKRSLLE